MNIELCIFYCKVSEKKEKKERTGHFVEKSIH